MEESRSEASPTNVNLRLYLKNKLKPKGLECDSSGRELD
jgi:hypothetical protein